jgi:cytochrome c oxidase assembly protein subunit 15
VLLQGLLGGLRVTLLKDEIGIVHATLAQSFFVLVTLIALFASSVGVKLIHCTQMTRPSGSLRWLTLGCTGLILVQLVLGATMRHQHAGLAVPDFPFAYGKVWPPMDAESLRRINAQRVSVEQPKPITGFQIGLHLAHRLVAFSIVLLVGGVAWKTRRELGATALQAKLSLAWLAIICVQASLGASTVWSNKAADVATSHVLVGALSLLTGTILSAVVIAYASDQAYCIQPHTASSRRDIRQEPKASASGLLPASDAS